MYEDPNKLHGRGNYKVSCASQYESTTLNNTVTLSYMTVTERIINNTHLLQIAFKWLYRNTFNRITQCHVDIVV